MQQIFLVVASIGKQPILSGLYRFITASTISAKHSKRRGASPYVNVVAGAASSELRAPYPHTGCGCVAEEIIVAMALIQKQLSYYNIGGGGSGCGFKARLTGVEE